MGEAQIFLFLLVVNLGEQQKDFRAGRSKGTGEGLSEPNCVQAVLAATGYSHNSRKQTSRLGSLDAIGRHHTAGDGFPAVLQAAVRG